MPWPSGITEHSGELPISTNFSVSLAGDGARDARVQAAVPRAIALLASQTGIPIYPHVVKNGEPATLAIVVEEKDHKGPQRFGDYEGYSLEVASDHARLSATRPLGVLRGLETFLQLVQENQGASATPGFSARAVTIRDDPRFGWRGLSLDVSRHFIGIDGIKRTLDGMSDVKLNVLHWHLSDDQGFRVESKKLPRLQQMGSNGHFYTQAQIRDVINYARGRGIRIVPEFDMPGHAASWLPGYPKLGVGPGPYNIADGFGILSHLLDPTKESTYRFLNTFIGEMTKLFPDEYFHIGGDEVAPREWNESAHVRAFMRKHNLADARALQAYFNQRVEKIVARHGKHMIGWDEVLHPDLPKSVVIQSWRGQQSLWDAARQGYQGILSAGYYLDLMYPAWYHYAVDPMKIPPPAPYSRHEDQPGVQQPPPGTPANLNPEQARLILGGEAAMWEELADEENIDSRLWPRLAAIAERFWSPEAETNPDSMYARLQVANRWLQWDGLQQKSGLEKMRERLAGDNPVQPLDMVASVLEPVKGYSRHAEKYTTSTPLTRLVDSIPPESETARKFNDAVTAFVNAPAGQKNSDALRELLEQWTWAARKAGPLFQNESLLKPDTAVLDTFSTLSRIGSDAITAIQTGKLPDPNWKQTSLATLQPLVRKRVNDLFVQIAPGIEQLVNAAPNPKGQ
jgi:hexosaminidase